MKKIACLIFILAHFILSAQNLVPNGSFEAYTNCPTSFNQLNYCSNWLNPTADGSPDYYNSCSSNYSVPHANCITCYQNAKSGNAFSGIYCYSPLTSDVREYIQTQLSSQLINTNYYLIKFYTNLSNNSQYAVNNIGAYISSVPLTLTTGSYILNYTPQILYPNLVKDTLNWIEIAGVYISNGTEQYVTIGNFTTDSQLNAANSNGNNQACYYYIDDVSVENITTPQWQYRDTTIYLGDSVLIGPAITGLNVDWFDMSNTFIKNAPGIYVKPIVTTPYKATETFNSVVYNHTVTVTVLLPSKVDEYNKLQKSVAIFPNPNNGNVSLQFVDLTEGNVDVTISDVTGKIVYESKLQISNSLSNFTIDVKGGVYFVKIFNSNVNKTLIKKLVVR